jgi:hypothetical protein
MKIKTKYNIGDTVKYFGEEFVDNGVCKCCKRDLQEMQLVKMKGQICNIDIRVEKDNISIEYEIENEFIPEKYIIKKVKDI